MLRDSKKVSNRLKYLKASLHCIGDVFAIDGKIEIIIFRILQEFFTNTIKHSKATELKVNVNYNNKTLTINAIDNGIGFKTSLTQSKKGIGLNNIKSRAKMINAEVKIISKENHGTKLHLTYKIE